MPLEPCRTSLIPRSPGWLRVLRLGLLLGGIGWGISFLFTFSLRERKKQRRVCCAAFRTKVGGTIKRMRDRRTGEWLEGNQLYDYFDQVLNPS